MKYSAQVKPISYLKANAAEVIRRLAVEREPLVITQNGEATAVLQDVTSLGNQQIARNKVVPARDEVARLRAKKTTRER
jgi:prevent-host-death family protein